MEYLWWRCIKSYTIPTTLRATLSGTVTGDLRFGFYGNKTSKTIDNAYIQADYGLN